MSERDVMLKEIERVTLDRTIEAFGIALRHLKQKRDEIAGTRPYWIEFGPAAAVYCIIKDSGGPMHFDDIYKILEEHGHEVIVERLDKRGSLARAISQAPGHLTWNPKPEIVAALNEKPKELLKYEEKIKSQSE